MRSTFLFVALALLAIPAGASPNLLVNPSLEQIGADQLPPHWEQCVVSLPGKFTIDESMKHDGLQSVRIDAPETTRLYLRSDPIPVAPGETITASAWVKCKDVPPGKGTIILIGEFTNNKDSATTVEKFATLDRKEASDVDWTKIEGSIKVPALMTNLRLRMGFSYAQGTTWWDDASGDAEQPLVVIDRSSHAAFEPGQWNVPVRIHQSPGWSRYESQMWSRVGWADQ